MDKAVSLKKILQELPLPVLSRLDHDVSVTGIIDDNRKIQQGMVFVAIKGSNTDAHQFIPDAIERGAAAVIGTEPGIQLRVPYIQVADSRRILPFLAAGYHDYPARKLTMIGVTGTDGKTTTTNLIFSILRAAEIPAGMISTVNAVIGSQVLDTGFHVTTPEAPDVQQYLSMMVEAGLTHAVLETTSHGWAQYRVDACEFDIGVLTNITHEHLNDHGSFDNYRSAKARLFQSLGETGRKRQGNPRLAVLNRDDTSFEFINGICSRNQNVKRVDYSLTPGASLFATTISHKPTGLEFHIFGEGLKLPIRSSLVGEYNVSNILAAIGATYCGLHISPDRIQVGVVGLPGIPGRMEHIHLGQDFTAIVDFAHTPNALKRTLETARQLTNGRIIVVFGSAGLRDQQKRVLMAEVAARLADYTILTAEDPRTESLEMILAEMVRCVEKHGGVDGVNYSCIPDRGKAIQFAVRLARRGDLVIACGKGHEQSMCFGTIEYPWDDRIALRAALADRLGIEGPAMPYLPTQD